MSEDLRIGIEIGGTKLQIALGNGSGRIIEKKRFSVDKAAGASGIRKTIEQHLPEIIKMGAHKIGVGFGGPVDWRTGKICRSHQIEGWSGFDIVGWLKSIGGISEIFVENDANVGALGEAYCGCGRGFNPVFYITLGSGVGGGLVVDGRIYHGDNPGECEIGHVRLDKNGATVESRCSGWAVDRKVREMANSNSSSILFELVKNVSGGEARYLKPAIERNDPLAMEILNQTADDLAFALSHVVHLFHPQVIILGGGLSNLGDILKDAVASRLSCYVMEAFKPAPEIKIAALGEDAVPVGALILTGNARNPCLI
jgi:glucokinase